MWALVRWTTVVALVTFAGCAKHGGPTGNDARGTAVSGNAPPPGSTLAVAGKLFTGQDQASIRGYLQPVKEIKPTAFDVEWNPATVAVSRDEAMRSLQSISRDGGTFRFATSEPVVAKLRRGSILWIWDLAVRKVDRVTVEDDVTVVQTEPVALTEALTRAHIAFDSPVGLPNYYMGAVPKAPAAAPAKTASVDLRPRFMLVSLNPDAPASQAPDPGNGSDTPSDDGGDEEDLDFTPLHGGYTGKLKSFTYSLAYQTRPNGVTITLEASNAEEGNEANETEKESSEQIAEKFKEITKEEKEAKKEEFEAEQKADALQKDLQTLDDQYSKDVAQLQADQAARTNPSYQGPNPPPVPTDSNGLPLSLQGQIDRLTKPYQNQRSVELAKIKDQLKIQAEAQKKKMDAEDRKKSLEEIGGFAKELYEVAKDNLDVRFRSKVDMDQFGLTGLLDIKNHNLENAAAQFKNVNGKVHVDFIGRFGKPGNGAIKVPVMHLPIAFNVPFPIGGLPFVIQLGADFLANVFLSGNHSTMAFNGGFAFNGSGGIHTTGASTNSDGTMTGGEPEVAHTAGMSPGVSGLVLGVQLPRLGFGFGVVGMSSVAYFDVVGVLTMTQSASAAAGLAAPPCRRTSLATVGHVGISTNIVPWPIPYVADKINDALSTKPKVILSHEKVVLDPPIKACEI